MNKKTRKEYLNGYEIVSSKDMSSRILKNIKKMTNKTPIKIPIRQSGMTATGRELSCHMNVEHLVRNYGGERITGYYINQMLDQTNLMPHAVWKTPEGKLVDVTQRTDEQNNGNPSQDKSVCYFIPITNDPAIAIAEVRFHTTSNKSFSAPISIIKVGKTFDGYACEWMKFNKPQKVIKFCRKISLSSFYQIDMDAFDWFEKVA